MIICAVTKFIGPILELFNFWHSNLDSYCSISLFDVPIKIPLFLCQKLNIFLVIHLKFTFSLKALPISGRLVLSWLSFILKRPDKLTMIGKGFSQEVAYRKEDNAPTIPYSLTICYAKINSLTSRMTDYSVDLVAFVFKVCSNSINILCIFLNWWLKLIWLNYASGLVDVPQCWNNQANLHFRHCHGNQNGMRKWVVFQLKPYETSSPYGLNEYEYYALIVTTKRSYPRCHEQLLLISAFLDLYQSLSFSRKCQQAPRFYRLKFVILTCPERGKNKKKYSTE